MIVLYTVEAIRGGFTARVASQILNGAAQARSRTRAIESAAALVLKAAVAAIEEGEVALADLFPLRFDEAESPPGKDRSSP